MSYLGDKDFAGGGYFGQYGGSFVAEPLWQALLELDNAFKKAQKDKKFLEKIEFLNKEYTGRPSLLTYAQNFSNILGADIYLKREDLNHTGAHKINNCLGQALLAKSLGKTRLIAETGAGQHGVATACAAAFLGMRCVIYMGEIDAKRQALNVFRMKTLGAEVKVVSKGSKTLKDAINEALRDWVSSLETTHYLLGTAAGPHPFPSIVAYFQSVIGKEAKEQFISKTGGLPDKVIACLGGGSNAIGIFDAFLDDKGVDLIGVEADGDTNGSAASLNRGSKGILHGCKTYLLQDEDGQTGKTHSISAGLDYPAIGPHHAYFQDSGKAHYIMATDAEAVDAFLLLAKTEGIIAALESSHALAGAIKILKNPDLIPVKRDIKGHQKILINLSGRGDKDMITIANHLGFKI